MMRVTAKLFATLGRYRPGELPGTPFEVELREGATVGELTAATGVPANEVKLVYVNGRCREPEHVLQPGDEVGIFPPVGGG